MTNQETIRVALEGALKGAGARDAVTLTRELTAAGIPTKYASSISRASRAATSQKDVDAIVDEWSKTIGDRLDQQKNLSVEELIANVPRL